MLVSGTFDCGVENGTETREGQFTIYRGTITCDVTMSDPRVSGREAGDITIVYLKDKRGKLVIDKWWGTTTLTNDGGTWRSVSAWGSEYTHAGVLRSSGTTLYIGEGAYAGLTYRQLFAQGVPEADAYIASGWIEPAK